MYELVTLKETPVTGKFYEAELSLVSDKFSSQLFKIEKIIKERKGQCFVRWLGYGPEHDSWINKKECMNLLPSA